MSTIAYRSEIDGLRAIAVLGAVGWHAQFNILGVDPVQGGFMGIELFFVISGYLITLIILREMQQDRFTIRNFYERRARRILPMLVTVMLACLPFAWLFMLPKAVEEFAGSVLSMLAFGSNFWFWQESSYWAEAAELKPLLHTWSLSVEEQFYVLFPLLLILLWRLGIQYTVPVFLVILVSSLTWAQVSVDSDPEGAFYLLPQRMWELIAGGLLAFLEMRNGRTSHAKLESSLPWAGLILIMAPVFLYHRDMSWPSLWTLVPVVGTMLVIWYTKPDHAVARLLSWKPIAGVGLISYSFYLWHFPVFAFARIHGPWPTQWEMLAYVIFSIVLSIATYNFIEKPFRNKRVMALSTFIPVILVASATVLMASSYAYLNDGLWGRYTDGQLQMLGVSENRDSYVDYVLEYAKTTRKKNEFSDPNDDNDLFVIGDSYSADFLNGLKEGGFLRGLEVLGHKISWDCLNVPEASDYQDFLKPKDIDRCSGVARVGHPDLAGRLRDAEYVLLISSWMDYTTSQLDKLLTAVESGTDAQVLIVGRKQFGRMNAQELVSYTQQEFLDKRQKSHSHLEWIAAVPESVKGNYLDLHRLFCGENDSCPIATPEGRLISYDGGHLTREGAVHLSRLLSRDTEFTDKWKSVFGGYLCPQISEEGRPCPADQTDAG